MGTKESPRALRGLIIDAPFQLNSSSEHCSTVVCSMHQMTVHPRSAGRFHMYNKSLLLVDDEISILRSYARDLRAEHYNVTTASNGDEAIRALWEDNFNMVVTDLVMPGLNGIEVLREAKKRNPEICVLVLTGYGDMPSAVEALRLGADDYLLKPLDTDELLLRLTEHLKKQNERQRLIFPKNIITLCAYCRSIKDSDDKKEQAEWMQWEEYLTRKTGVTLSHGCCPTCYEKIKIEWKL